MGNLNHLWWTDVDEDGWRCRKHPSWQQALQGVCPACLRQRLLLLCPDCATVKPCPCSAAASSSLRYSSLSILLSLDPVDGRPSSGSGREASTSSSIGAVGRIGSLIECEPAFRRSRSAAFGLLRNRSGESSSGSKRINSGWRLPSWLSIKPDLKSKTESVEDEAALVHDVYVDDDGKAMRAAAKLYRSRSVGFGTLAFQNQQEHQPPPVRSVPPRPRLSTASKEAVSSEMKRKGWHRWYFPSPMKAFGHRSKSGAATGRSVVQQQRSPICRG